MGKIIIMGPGRCGTTVLAQLFRAIDEDLTGSCDEIFREKRTEIANDPNFKWPKVIKGTGTLCVGLNRWVKEKQWDVDIVFLCVRELEANIKSMIKKKRGQGVYKHFSEKELEKRIRVEIPRGYAEAREQIKAGKYNYCEIEFPRSARDKEYTYNIMIKAIPNISKKKFNEIWNKTIKPEKIRFGPN